jgi:DNA-binding transcriptional LysR family regulator
MNALGEMQVFVCAIERGTFAGAAKQMGMTPSAISKIVTRLERRIGVRLANRNTRRIALTDEGTHYFQRGRDLIQAFQSLEEEVSASAGQPRGLLRVNCAAAFGLRQLAPVFADFHARYPDVSIELSLNDHIMDLHSERIDVAIRTMKAQRDSSLMVRKLAETRRVICASPAYIDAFGEPLTPEDLSRHQCILFWRENEAVDRWPFRRSDGGGIEHIDVTGKLASDNSECVLQMALAGAGIIRMDELVVSSAIRNRQLMPLLLDLHVSESLITWAVFHAGSQNIPRMRVFLDFIVKNFASAA